MYFFSHLFVGLLIGIAFFWWTRDRWLIPACALGAVLPDLVDKPLGLLLMNGSLYLSRSYFHSLVLFLVVLALGILFWYSQRSYLILGVAAGMFSHQALDQMWREYWNWLWPFYGPFSGGIFEEYLLARLFEVFSNPLEWILGLCVMVACLLLFIRGESLLGERKENLVFLAIIAVAMTIAGMLFLSYNYHLV